MAVVSEVKVGTGSAARGTFHAKLFNLLKEEELAEYAELRTRAADKSTGIEIESIREFVKKTTTTEGDGVEMTTSTVEQLHLVVQWWERPSKDKGVKSDDAKTGWFPNP